MESLKKLYQWQQNLSETEKMPALFLGHGSPMNAIDENIFVQNWRKLALEIPKPRAILVISAHWETKGTKVTAMEHPRTIHDFGGFPKALFEVQYPAQGDPELAEYISGVLNHFTEVELDQVWGLDHGNWSVVRHLYPNADIPVLQLSLDYSKPAHYHYELARELQILRKKGILIIGSGNMVHNLRMIAWDNMLEPGFGYDWALEINEKMKDLIVAKKHQELINYQHFGLAGNYAIPSPEHYLPLLYSLAVQDEKDEISFLNDIPVGGSLTMTSVVLK
ncbi:4,5-DOPA dioxygenase extradiol [Pseudopedobacter beijingensis]|uniref:4,5-DOPA dioxygenase extradiol n=1 Tax=Pseudopedobacter beijingensis TaxID=1207056 RepID=A0ABW4IFX8_9SPHI